MISVAVIRNGSTYLGQHLRKNDYWSEGEREREGEWIGLGAERLGLAGAVTEQQFSALRLNRHPHTGEQLTARQVKDRVAFFDVQFSAPKDFSVLAMVGDDRLVEAFHEAARTAIVEMEHYAAVRERRGANAQSEAHRLTGNIAAAVFFHDTSRDLDPQLHAHAVIANATWDGDRQQWFALQAAPMLRASKYVRQVFYRELYAKVAEFGYDAYDLGADGFSIRGVEHLRERYSKRSQQVKARIEAFTQQHCRKPTKKEVAVLVRESRGRKLAEASTPDVRARQRAELSRAEAAALREMVNKAERLPPRRHRSVGSAEEVLASALRHVYERNSVAREDEVLSASLLLHPGFFEWRALREALHRHSGVLREDGEMTLREIVREEHQAVSHAKGLRNRFFPLGRAEDLPDELKPGQRRVAKVLLESRDGVTVLIGDAGTGKTTLLAALEDSHRIAGGAPFIALAPTTKARDALRESGFSAADTVQRFLVQAPRELSGRVVLIDEAGLLSTKQIAELLRHAAERRFRVLLVGDPKQHYSVERGDALRHVIQHADLVVTRLTEVMRQRSSADREVSELLARGKSAEALRRATERGLVKEQEDEDRLFDLAAEHYAENRSRGVDTLVVIPLWEEIERFNVKAREAMRAKGLLGSESVERLTLQPLSWTDEQKGKWSQYREGDHLAFVRETRLAHRGDTARVVRIEKDGLRVQNQKGRRFKVTRRQKGSFEVAREALLTVAAGDRILIRARGAGFNNGEILNVTGVDPATRAVHVDDGRIIPPDFRTWTYAHALTSYRSQGTTVEESILVLGHRSAELLQQRQFYVGNTRYRGAHHIYLASVAAVARQLQRADPGRELATEFIERRRMVAAHVIGQRPLQRLQRRVRQWIGWMTQRRAARHEARRQEV